MNEKSIKNISTKDLYLIFLIKTIDKYENNSFIGRFFYIENYILGIKDYNDEFDYINILTGQKYKKFYQEEVTKYKNGEIRVMLGKPINIEEEYISYYEATNILRKYYIEYDGEKLKKVRVKKIVRKRN